MEFTRDNTLQEMMEYPWMAQGMRRFFSEFLLDMIPKEMWKVPLSEMETVAKTPWEEPFSVVTDQLLSAAKTVLEITEDGTRRCIPLWSMKEGQELTGSMNWAEPGDAGKDSVFLLAPACAGEGAQEGKGKRPAVIICPGGGYTDVCFSNEGNPMMRRMEQAGYRAFVLKYRVSPARFPDPQEDLALAIQYVRSYSEAYGVDPGRILIMGSSAGGHLCAYGASKHESIQKLLARELTDCNHPLAHRLLDVSARPDLVCLNYPVISFLTKPHEGSFYALTGGEESLRKALSAELLVTEDYPPCFLWACEDDDTVPAENTRIMLEALKRHGVRCEGHVYPTGGHGCGLALTKSAREWSERMLHFMDKR